MRDKLGDSRELIEVCLDLWENVLNLFINSAYLMLESVEGSSCVRGTHPEELEYRNGHVKTPANCVIIGV